MSFDSYRCESPISIHPYKKKSPIILLNFNHNKAKRKKKANTKKRERERERHFLENKRERIFPAWDAFSPFRSLSPFTSPNNSRGEQNGPCT